MEQKWKRCHCWKAEKCWPNQKAESEVSSHTGDVFPSLPIGRLHRTSRQIPRFSSRGLSRGQSPHNRTGPPTPTPSIAIDGQEEWAPSHKDSGTQLSAQLSADSRGCATPNPSPMGLTPTQSCRELGPPLPSYAESFSTDPEMAEMSFNTDEMNANARNELVEERDEDHQTDDDCQHLRPPEYSDSVHV